MNNTKQNIKTDLFEMPLRDLYIGNSWQTAMQNHGCIGPNSTIFYNSSMSYITIKAKGVVIYPH